MTKRSLLLLLALLVAVPAVICAVDSISVINRTGYDIYYLYVSPETADSWGDDVLGDDVLMDGDSTTLTLGKFADVNIFDIKAVDEDDDSYIKWEYNAGDRSKIILTLDDLYVEDDGDGSIQDFTIFNDTGFTIYHIYVSPDYADDWEDDLLGASDIVMDDDSFDVTFSGYDDHCTFDVRVVDEDGDSYTQWGVELCSVYSVTFTLDDIDG